MNAAPASIPPTMPRIAAALRRIRLLPRRSLSLGLLRLDFEVPERALQVVEDEPHRWVDASRRGDPGRALPHDEDASLLGRRLELRQLGAVPGLDTLSDREQL